MRVVPDPGLVEVVQGVRDGGQRVVRYHRWQARDRFQWSEWEVLTGPLELFQTGVPATRL